jgi:uncharacterized Zn finger protein
MTPAICPSCGEEEVYQHGPDQTFWRCANCGATFHVTEVEEESNPLT